MQWVTLEAGMRKRVVELLSRDENKWLNGCNEALGKRKRYGQPSTRAPTLKSACFIKNGYRLIAVANMSLTFNKHCIFTFCVYASKSSSTFSIGKFYLHFK